MADRLSNAILRNIAQDPRLHFAGEAAFPRQNPTETGLFIARRDPVFDEDTLNGILVTASGMPLTDVRFHRPFRYLPNGTLELGVLRFDDEAARGESGVLMTFLHLLPNIYSADLMAQLYKESGFTRQTIAPETLSRMKSGVIVTREDLFRSHR